MPVSILIADDHRIMAQRLVSLVKGERGLEVVGVADSLDISAHTVVRHRQNVMKKLDIHSVAGLTRYGIRENLSPL